MQQNINTIWSELNDHLEGFVIKKVGDRDAARDIVHDVFLKVQSKISTLKDDKKVTPWIFQITRNTITDYYRAQQKEFRDISRIESLEDELEKNETREFSQCVIPMIEALSEKYKEALLLSEIEGLSQMALAERLGISYSGAKSRVQRGRAKLKELLIQCCTITADSYGNIIDYHQNKCSGDCN